MTLSPQPSALSPQPSALSRRSVTLWLSALVATAFAAAPAAAQATNTSTTNPNKITSTIKVGGTPQPVELRQISFKVVYANGGGLVAQSGVTPVITGDSAYGEMTGGTSGTAYHFIWTYTPIFYINGQRVQGATVTNFDGGTITQQ